MSPPLQKLYNIFGAQVPALEKIRIQEQPSIQLPVVKSPLGLEEA
jgi:hypothetical protein